MYSRTTTGGIRQGYLPLPAIFNVFLETIMQEVLTSYYSPISVNGRPICNLRFAVDIDLMAGNTEEQQDLSTRVERSSRLYGMAGSTPNSKEMVNSILIIEMKYHIFCI